MSKVNAAWHEKHPLQRNATVVQRVAWHVAHATACGCRDIPRTIVTELRARGIPIPRRSRVSVTAPSRKR
jgi:hypothetical protein